MVLVAPFLARIVRLPLEASGGKHRGGLHRLFGFRQTPPHLGLRSMRKGRLRHDEIELLAENGQREVWALTELGLLFDLMPSSINQLFGLHSEKPADFGNTSLFVYC